MAEPIRADSISSLHASLLKKAETLMLEMEAFKRYLDKHRINVSMSKFCKDVDNEVKAIKQVQITSDDLDDETNIGLHRLRSSNLVFYEAVWNIAKQNKQVTALQRRTRWVSSGKTATDRVGSRNHILRADMANLKLKENIVVDVVAEHGRKWIKVWTKSPKRLLLDLAKEGLVRTDSSDDDDFLDEEDNSLRLTRLANDLRDAARNVRVQHQHPTVHFILPNIAEGEYFEIDAVLRAIRATGATVECGDSALVEEKPNSPEALESVFLAMAPASNSQSDLTNILNLDCTLIVALVSDISHVRPEDVVVPQHYEGSTFRTINSQIKSEIQSSVLRDDLYPILCGHNLVCTENVAAHMQKILHPMGTPTELARMNIVLGYGEYADSTQEQLRTALQKFSAYPVPSDLRLPVEAISFLLDQFKTSTPIHDDCSQERHVAKQLFEHPKLTFLNASAFISGWMNRTTTVTLNRTVANWIIRHVDELLDEWEQSEAGKDTSSTSFSGPAIHVCNRDRSLLGSEKSSRA